MVDYKLVKILENIAFLLEFSGENKFKALAYSNAASLIEDEEIDVHKLVEIGKINEISGFGQALVSKLTDYVKNGKMEFYEKLIQNVPEEIAELKQISGLGVAKIKYLVENYGIKSINDLDNAIENNLLQNAKGFTPKAILQIKNSINNLREYKKYTYLHIATEEAENIVKSIKYKYQNEISDGKLRVDFAGEVRRIEKIISSIDIIIGINDLNDFNKYFDDLKDLLLDYKFINPINDIQTETNHIIYELQAKCNIKLSFYFVKLTNFEISKHNLNSSEEYFEAFREYLSYSNMKLEKFSLKNLRDAENEVKLTNAADLYKNIGFTYIEPENRDLAQTVEFSMKNALPTLVTAGELKGMLHCHSTWSDGKNTIEEMALASRDLGFEYFGLCDHSRTAAYANGLSIERVLEQHEQIDKLNEKFKENNIGMKILKGIESDILPDGSLDYPDEILAKFDFIVASVHSSFKMTLNEMTERVSKALENPYTTILGHPTGRILLQRYSYQIDLEQIINIAEKNKKILEINASPYRLDLDIEWVSLCKAKNVKIAINPDAHNTKGLRHIKYGFYRGRKSWLESKDVVNTMSVNDFLKLAKEIREVKA